MDNNPEQTNQPNVSQTPGQTEVPVLNVSPDDPFFSSTDLTNTKAHRNTEYFTNVQKATPWQKFSNWIANLNRDSLERSVARRAEFKAKLAKRRQAADLAAISAAVPDISLPQQPNSKPASPAPAVASVAPRPAAQTPVEPNPAAATNPAPAPNITPQAPPTIPPAPAEASTVIIETPARPASKNRKTLIALIIILAVLFIGVIAAIFIIHPWANQPSIVSLTGQAVTLKSEPIPAIDVATTSGFEAIVYRTNVLNSTTLDVYADSQLPDSDARSPYVIANNIDKVLQANHITDSAAILLFDLEKARVFIIYDDYDAAWEILGQIDEAELFDSQKEAFFTVMQLYYEATGDTEKADEYFAKYEALPIAERGE